MTRVFVYEWCCGTGPGGTPRAEPLWPEGWAMLAAAVEDFRRVAGVRVTTLLGAPLRGEPAIAAAVAGWPDVAVTWVTGDEPAAFRAAAADADHALVIAPEFDRILEARCRWATAAGAALLGPSPEAVALTADKLALAGHLELAGVPTPETTLLYADTNESCATVCWQTVGSEATHGLPANRGTSSIARSGPWVVKPRYGAGSQDMALVTGLTVRRGANGDRIVQPFVPGRSASVAFLIGSRQTVALAPAWQDLSADGCFQYRGGSAPLPPPLADRAVRIARRAVDAVDGLAGYVGVDVVLGADGDSVIEINPRLTTSYVGLRALADDNLMDVLLRLVRGESAAKLRWRAGGVSWSATGQVERLG